MLADYLAKIGQRLDELQLGNPPGWNTAVYISAVITVDKKGNVTDIEYFDKPVRKYHPVMFYGDAFSDYVPREMCPPHLLCPRVSALTDKTGTNFKLFLENLQKLDAYQSTPQVQAVIRCLQKSDFENILDLSVGKLCVTFAVKSKTGSVCLLDDTLIKEVTASFLRDTIRDGVTDETVVCEVTGQQNAYHIRKHSKIFRGGKSPRISTRQCYDYYYDPGYKTASYNLCNMGAWTELLVGKAAAYIYDNTYTMFADTRCLFDFADGSLYPLDISLKGLMGDLYDGADRTKWQDCAAAYMQRADRADLCYLSFAPYSQGRISAGGVKRFTAKESAEVLQNFMHWMDLTTVWAEDGSLIYALPSMYSLITERYRYRAGAEDRIKRQCDIAHRDLLRAIWHKDYVWIIHGYILPLMQKYIRQDRHKYSRILANLVHRMMMEVCDMYVIADTIDFKVGRLLAVCHLIEHYGRFKNEEYERMSAAEKYLPEFAVNSRDIWLMVRQATDKYMHSRLMRSTDLCQILTDLETDLSLIDWDTHGFDGAIVCMGYDVQLREWYDNRKQKKELEVKTDD